MHAGSIYLTIANSGYQSDWVAVSALECCSNMTGSVSCGSSSGIVVSPSQNATIAFETSYQYIFNISEYILDKLVWLFQYVCHCSSGVFCHDLLCSPLRGFLACAFIALPFIRHHRATVDCHPTLAHEGLTPQLLHVPTSVHRVYMRPLQLP